MLGHWITEISESWDIIYLNDSYICRNTSYRKDILQYADDIKHRSDGLDCEAFQNNSYGYESNLSLDSAVIVDINGWT